MSLIKEMRERAGITQEVTADTLKVGRSAVSKWETGKAMPTADKLPQLATLYKCSVDDFFRGSIPTDALLRKDPTTPDRAERK